MEGWKDGRGRMSEPWIQEKRSGRMEEWKGEDGRAEVWKDGRVYDFFQYSS